MTAAEIVSLAFSRDVSPLLIKAADIVVARNMYVDAYIVDAIDENSTFYTSYVKPVIAYGVAVNVFERLSTEVSERGVVQMVTQGAMVNSEMQAKAKNEYAMMLNECIRLMVEQAIVAGYSVNTFDYSPVTGATNVTHNAI